MICLKETFNFLSLSSASFSWSILEYFVPINPTNALWENLILCRQKLVLNSNESLTLFRQIQILRSTRHKKLQNKTMNIFLELLDVWLSFSNNRLPTFCHIDEILDQFIFWNPLIKLVFNSTKPYFYCILPKNTTFKFTITRDIYKFVQPGLGSTRSEEKSGHS